MMQVWTSHEGTLAKVIVLDSDQFTGGALALAHGLEPSTLLAETGSGALVHLGSNVFDPRRYKEPVS